MKATIKRLYHADTPLGSFIRSSYRTIARPMVHRLRERYIQRKSVAELSEISEIFTRNSCVWSLQSGNVLGIYRDGGFLKNEDDVDIAVLAEDWHVGIEEELRHHGYTIDHAMGGY